MKKQFILIVLLIVGITLVGCQKERTLTDVKKEIEQIVIDVYNPITVKQFSDSYKRSIESGLLTEDAAKSLYVMTSEDKSNITDSTNKRSSYVNVMYSNKEDNSENKSFYLAKLTIYENDAPKISADIFFYVKDDIDETKETIIDKVTVANVKILSE